MLKRFELKQYAKRKVKGKRIIIWKGLIIFFILNLFTPTFTTDMIESNPQLFIFTVLMLTAIKTPLEYGFADYMIFFDQYETGQIERLFHPYHKIIKIFVLTVFSSFIIYLGFIFFIIPGMILSLGYAIIPYIFTENEDLSIMEIMSLSRHMMKGHKMELFILEISFIGWMFLSIMTLGIMAIWVMPYYHMTMAKFFMNIKEEFEYQFIEY